MQRKLNAKQKAKMSQVLLRSFHLEEKKELKTRPSILCVTHQMVHKNRNYLVGLTLRNEMMDYKVIPVGTLWYWISVWQYWLVLDGTGSVWGGTGWYLVVLGQCNLVLLDIKWNWVSTPLLWRFILK